MIEEKVGNSLEHMSTGEYFLHITAIEQTQKSTTNKWDLLKLKSSVGK